MLDVRQVGVSFAGRAVLDGFDLSVGDGEVVALLGPSGSGKSTLLRVIAGLIVPQRGSVWIDATDVTRLPTHRRNVGMVFQDEQLFPHLDVAANVSFGPRMHGWDRAATDARVGELLELVGLESMGSRSVGRLSGGEAKRVALARSLAPRPAVLLLDEPLTGLDRDLHDRLMADLGRLLAADRTTAVLVTHDLDEAEALASHTVSMALTP